MNEPSDIDSPTPFADLAQLRREVDVLHRVIRVLLLGLVLATAALCLFMYRQSQLLRFQILAQQAAVLEADKQHAPLLGVLPLFQQIGGRYPDYSSNVLRKFNLPPLAPTNPPVKRP
ncbi:MAG: hypothetical protein J0M24_20875 [Verrucomicrobia bacterium]|nr:hypothetical protein [Verrucomicrobiota bacterium]